MTPDFFTSWDLSLMNSRNHFAKLLAVSLLTMCSVSSVVIGEMPSPITVNSSADTGDNDLTDTYCGTANTVMVPNVPPPGSTPTLVPVQNTCTLRAAIQNANRNSQRDEIRFAAALTGAQGTLTLTSDLPDITSPVTIDTVVASGPGAFVVDGAGQFAGLRFGQVTTTADSVSPGDSSILQLTIQNTIKSSAQGGSGIYFAPAGFGSTLTLTNVTLAMNSAAKVANGPNAGPGGFGGAVRIEDGEKLKVIGGSITGNTALKGGRFTLKPSVPTRVQSAAMKTAWIRLPVLPMTCCA